MIFTIYLEMFAKIVCVCMFIFIDGATIAKY